MVLLSYLGGSVWNTFLFLLVAVLPWIVVAFVMQLISNSIRDSLAKVFGIQGYIYLTCPGVMIHEIGHAVFCIIFGHKILEMKLFSPEKDGTLGYVSHSYNSRSFYQRIGNFFIGTGPVWFGIACLWLVSRLLLPNSLFQGSNDIWSGIGRIFALFFSMDFWGNWQSYLWLYLALTISSHITLSPPDLDGAADGAVVIFVVSLLGFLLLGWCGNWESMLIGFCKHILGAVSGFLLFFIIILLILSTVCHLLTGRK